MKYFGSINIGWIKFRHRQKSGLSCCGMATELWDELCGEDSFWVHLQKKFAKIFLSHHVCLSTCNNLRSDEQICIKFGTGDFH
jgi:hypothetical protein